MAHENAAESLQLDRLNNEVARIRRALRMRNFWAVVPLSLASAVAFFFNWWRDGGGLWSALGSVIFIMLAISVTFNWLRAKRLTRSEEPALRACLEKEIGMLAGQKQWLMNGYWFVLLLFGTVVSGSISGYHGRTGSYVPNGVLWSYYFAGVVVCVLAYWLCRYEARRRYDPLLSQLEQLRRDLTSSGDA